MPVTKEDIRRTAGLARLRLSEAELDSMTETLGKVFEYIDQLHEVDTEGVKPLHHVLDMSNVTEDDVPRPCFSREEALGNAPDRTDEFFRLPRVVN
ncbi:Asp-tRNA(Asn)/Glu-tRNA(Gln) amidotransferase subunit GatC [bacterium]|nr:Asp-tRNA(Asn)/Glu-tRNA(Gln) amidotransferase subunit GatC [bacterium]MBU1985553.1 Asp-tRNA(Asn)/Glu-tRNA(Gln) amidotransferase subunit GatC [bacterium]